MVSIERIIQYCELPSEPVEEGVKPPIDWPLSGHLHFHNVFFFTKILMIQLILLIFINIILLYSLVEQVDSFLKLKVSLRYNESSNPVLKNIEADILPKEKVCFSFRFLKIFHNQFIFPISYQFHI